MSPQGHPTTPVSRPGGTVHMEKKSLWWYSGEGDKICGPFAVAKIVQLFEEGSLDGLTMITSDSKLPREKWMSLSSVTQIRKAIADAEEVESSQEDKNPENNSVTFKDETGSAAELPHKSKANNVTGNAANPKPDIDVAALQEAKRLSRKRRRVTKRLKQRAATSIYVSGLPKDATFDEVATYFSKCGIILPSSENGRPRVKLYVTDSGELKGDALITYALAPSVENAVQLLDGVPLRYGGENMTVQQASFEHKDEADKQETVTKALEGAKRVRVGNGSQAIVLEALSWAEDGQSQSRAPRIVLLKNVFNPVGADYDIIREDMAEGCSDFGEVEKITVFERSPEGAVAIKFMTAAAAKQCIEVMDKRWYDKRRLSAAFFDGTDYRVKDADQEQEKHRDAEWSKWLEGDAKDSEPNQ